MNMHAQRPLVLTLGVTDPRLDDEEREALAQGLYGQLRGAQDDVGDIRRQYIQAPVGTKSAAATAIGVLTAIVSATSLKAFFAHLTERVRGREITIEMEVDGRKIKITARSAEDLTAAHNAAVDLLAAGK